MNAVMVSVPPNDCKLIADGVKSVILTKVKPKLKVPFVGYIYCTDKKARDNSWQYKPNLYKDSSGEIKWIDVAFDSIFNCEFLQQKVIGEFICNRIITAELGKYYKIPLEAAQVDAYDLVDYANDNTVYGFCVSKFKVYDKPKKLSDFKKPCTAKDLPNDCKSCKFYFPGTAFAEPYCRDGERELKRPPNGWYYVTL